MKRLLFITAFVTCASTMFAQVTFSFLVECRDDSTNLKIEDVIFSCSHDSEKIIIQGTTFYKINSGIDTFVTLRAVADNYSKIIKQINTRVELTDSVYQLFMHSNDRDLGIVIISTLPKIVFQSEKESVHDFEFNGNGEMILVTYPKTQKKFREVRYFRNDSTIHKRNFDGSIEELVKDFRGNVHAITKDFSFQFSVKNDSVNYFPTDRSYYLRYLAPILDSIQTKKYLSNYSAIYPAFEYYVFDEIDSTYGKIVGITDTFMMELYRSEIKWVDVRIRMWARQKEQETGIDKEIWVGANYFTNSLFYKKLFAPMFRVGNELILLDYANGVMMNFDNKGRKLSATKINHGQENEKKTGWCRKVIKDELTDKIYVCFNRDGYTFIRLLNTQNGTLGRERKLHHRYIDKIRINNSKAFYIYRPFESMQKKYLYSEDF